MNNRLSKSVHMNKRRSGHRRRAIDIDLNYRKSFSNTKVTWNSNLRMRVTKNMNSNNWWNCWNKKCYRCIRHCKRRRMRKKCWKVSWGKRVEGSQCWRVSYMRKRRNQRSSAWESRVCRRWWGGEREGCTRWKRGFMIRIQSVCPSGESWTSLDSKRGSMRRG